MSGSFDRPAGRPAPHHATQPETYDPYDDVVTGPVTGPPPGGPFHHSTDARAFHEAAPRPLEAVYRPPSLEAGPREDAYAPAREDRAARRDQSRAPIVPAGSVTGRSLTLVVSIMCFLACLTAGAVYMINESASAWLKDIASEITVQVEPQEKVDTEKTLKEVTTFLAGTNGIAGTRILSVENSAQLLEPWLGHVDVLKQLPVPRLIAIELDRNAPPDLDAVRSQLEKKFAGVTLDDHRRWQQQIRTVTRSFALGGLAILALVAAATTAIIISATKSSMASNKEIVEVLHFVGATDRFISREFEKHFLRLGIRAGFVGAASAMLVFLTMPTVMELLGGGGVTIAEMQRLIGTGALDLTGYLLLGLIVVVVAALCMLTSRFSVVRILNARH
jgi:cell division transport system permease protein